ncbi:MAG TPA: hypothetical protein PLK24_08530 [Atribacter sp.]|uniref:hypothetical protein n=1 Tax=Atribacter sp. TaxID=2847780 RepID=UPI002C0EDE63|nr:hypothetical protein [Atribacter sp.]HQK83968.1 hypothetical protein [Atribacter sp.]
MAISFTESVILRIPVTLTGRRENLIHPLRHSEECLMRRDNLIRLLRHCEERPMRRGNLIL